MLLVGFGILLLIMGINYYFLVKTKNRLLVKNSEADRLLKNIDKYLSIIVHDLKSPLDSYQGLAITISYLIKTKQFEKINLVSKQIDKTGTNISPLLSNLISWSKAQDLSKEVGPNDILLFDIVNDVLSKYKDIAALNNIELILYGPRGYFISRDKDTLCVMFKNILDNALKICDLGGIIFLDLKRNPNEVLVRVSNTLDKSKRSDAKKKSKFS
ncbi:MAG: signal transduction histidine kinase [Arcticibacterium sp.]|jgi:signal transduction histidine kinase